jgi:hypothetical protein
MDSGRIVSVDRTNDALSTMIGVNDDYTNESDDEDVDGDTDNEDDEEGNDSGDELANSFLDSEDLSPDDNNGNANENEIDALGRESNSLVYQVMVLWLKQRPKLIHNYSLVGYILAPQHQILRDASL